MNFGQFIEAIGINSKDYPKLADVEVEIIDRKNRKIEGNVKFPIPLFFENSISEKKFQAFLENENKCLTDSITIIQVRFTDGFLIIYYPPNSNPKGLFKF